MKKKITILDYGLGNIRSLKNSLELITKNVNFFSDEQKKNFDILFIPGVGSFAKATEILHKKKLDNLIIESSKRDVLIIGICLGMQILFKTGYEDGKSDGLNLINGYVDLIPIKNKKLPNIGWRKIQIGENKKFSSLKKFDKEKFYFVHSFMANVKDTKEVISFTNYGNIKIPAIVFNKNVIGIQFHPEKSRENGIELLKEIINIY